MIPEGHKTARYESLPEGLKSIADRIINKKFNQPKESWDTRAIKKIVQRKERDYRVRVEAFLYLPADPYFSHSPIRKFSRETIVAEDRLMIVTEGLKHKIRLDAQMFLVQGNYFSNLREEDLDFTIGAEPIS